MDVDAKLITLNVYECDEDGTLIDFDTTTTAQPKANCLSVKISKKEEMQVGKLRIKINGAHPYVEPSELLLDVVEGEFGFELVEPAAQVNINTAGLDTLTSLDGIGETKAQAIIDHREAHGAFTAPEWLMQVPGIGEALYNEIQAQITV